MTRAGDHREAERLAVLRRIDFQAVKPVFDRLCRLARRATGAPYAFVGLMEAEQLWLAGAAEADDHWIARRGPSTRRSRPISPTSRR
jgi:hypothetical protein